MPDLLFTRVTHIKFQFNFQIYLTIPKGAIPKKREAKKAFKDVKHFLCLNSNKSQQVSASGV